MSSIERLQDDKFRFFKLITINVPKGSWSLQLQELSEFASAIWLVEENGNQILGSIQIYLANSDPTEPDISQLTDKDIPALDAEMESAITVQMPVLKYMGSKLNESANSKVLITPYTVDDDGAETQYLAVRTTVADQRIVMIGTFLVDRSDTLAAPMFSALQEASLRDERESVADAPQRTDSIDNGTSQTFEDPFLREQLDQLEAWYKNSAYRHGALPCLLTGTDTERKQFTVNLEGADISREDKFDFIRYVLSQEAVEYYQYGSLCMVLDELSGATREELALVVGSKEQAITSHWWVDRISRINPTLTFASGQLVPSPNDFLTTSFLSNGDAITSDKARDFGKLWESLQVSVERKVFKSRVSDQDLFHKPLSHSKYWSLDGVSLEEAAKTQINTHDLRNSSDQVGSRWSASAPQKTSSIATVFWSLSAVLILTAIISMNSWYVPDHESSVSVRMTDSTLAKLNSDCTVSSSVHGEGKWFWGNGGFVVRFEAKQFGFAKYDPPFPDAVDIDACFEQ